jgi:hypothetical protein
VNWGSSTNPVQIAGQMTPAEVARFRRWLGGPVRRVRTLMDCPLQELSFRPFHLASPGDLPVYLEPGKPDTGPMAPRMYAALVRIAQG